MKNKRPHALESCFSQSTFAVTISIPTFNFLLENFKKVFVFWLSLVESAISKISESKGFQWERIMLNFHITMYFIHKIKWSIIKLSWKVIFQSWCNASVWNGLDVFRIMFFAQSWRQWGITADFENNVLRRSSNAFSSATRSLQFLFRLDQI